MRKWRSFCAIRTTTYKAIERRRKVRIIPTAMRTFVTSLVSGQPQYCSLNDHNPFGNIDATGALALSGPEIVVAHLALYAAEVDPVPTGDKAFLEDFPQDRFMQGFPLPRGE
jgi:hypothetical protein